MTQTTVASDSGATVEIDPGDLVKLVVVESEISVTVASSVI